MRAAAATAIAFLACHPIGAKGDDCMWGPYREVLLQAGALEVLLEAALAPTQDDNCRKVIEKAAAVGIMYLCTVVSLAAPVGAGSRPQLWASCTSALSQVQHISDLILPCGCHNMHMTQSQRRPHL